MNEIAFPRVSLTFELACGCAFRYELGIEPEDLQDPLVVARGLAEALDDDGVQEELANCGSGHDERGQEGLTIRAKVER